MSHSACKRDTPAGMLGLLSANTQACPPVRVLRRYLAVSYELVAGAIVSAELTDLAKFLVPRNTSRKLAAFL